MIKNKSELLAVIDFLDGQGLIITDDDLLNEGIDELENEVFLCDVINDTKENIVG